MNIELVEFTEDYLIPKDGRFLVRTISSSKTKMLQTHQFVHARASIVWSEKNKRYETRVDVTNQIVTHISKESI